MSTSSAGIVLTGGLSSRMGTDKATLVVDGVRLVDRVTDAVVAAGVDRVVLAGPPVTTTRAKVETVADPTERPEGPLSGIVSAWRHLVASDDVEYDPVVVVSCDLPQIDGAVLATLLTNSQDHVHGAVAHDGLRPQPLIAAYRPAALDKMVKAFGEGARSVRMLFAGWDLALIRFEADALADADTPDDLAPFVVGWPDEPMDQAAH